MTIDKELQKIHLTMFNKEKEVFSGELKELPDFLAGSQKADRAELYNAEGSAVALMRYQDLRFLFGDHVRK